MRFTKRLGETLDIEPEAYPQVKEEFIRLQKLYRASKIEAGPHSAVRSMHLYIDQKASENKLNSQISCQKGCGHCCKMDVQTTRDEIDWLKTNLALNAEIQPDYGIGMSQMNFEDNHWPENVPTKTKCMFLSDENNCMVYETRPANCRIYKVLSPAAECETSTHNTVKIVNDAYVEIAASVILTESEIGSIPKLFFR